MMMMTILEPPLFPLAVQGGHQAGLEGNCVPDGGWPAWELIPGAGADHDQAVLHIKHR